MTSDQAISLLQAYSSPTHASNLARYAIQAPHALGVKSPDIKLVAKRIGINHALALDLWHYSTHEAKLLAVLLADHRLLTPRQLDSWAHDFYSWDICDHACTFLFRKTPFAYEKAEELANRQPEYVRRCGLVMMTTLALHDKGAEDEKILPFLNYVNKYADDERNFVLKAVNWLLRQVGKRSLKLNIEAIQLAGILAERTNKASRWVGKDALRELESEKIQLRLKRT
ncbi:MAG: DNA alkylation repair protein [Cyclobacteriaceae bacterium]|nr:DNA alkylation repair protein [Cyclobacteriaceae bacterium HetDA_MAG_MS6]